MWIGYAHDTKRSRGGCEAAAACNINMRDHDGHRTKCGAKKSAGIGGMVT